MNLWDVESIDKGIAEIIEYRTELAQKARELGETLVADGIEIMRMKIREFDAIETGELLESVDGWFDSVTGIGIISVNSAHAAFVEYGTGVVGKTVQSLAIDKPSNWQYDVNNHGWDGWYYLDKGQKRWTRGMPPRPFVWGTRQELIERAQALFAEYFG